MDKNMLDTPLKNASEYLEFRKVSKRAVDNVAERNSLKRTAEGEYVEAIKSLGESYFIEREVDGLQYMFDHKTRWLERVLFVIFRILIIIGAIIGEALGIYWYEQLPEDSPLVFVIFILTFLLIPMLVYLLWKFTEDISNWVIYLFWKIYKKSSKYLADCDKAKQNGINEYKLDLERVLREQEEAKRKVEQLNSIDNTENELIYNEWMNQVVQLRTDALQYGIDEYVSANSDSKLVEIMLDKMPYELTTPRILMEKARIKATNDWIEIRTSMSNINAIFDDLNRKG